VSLITAPTKVFVMSVYALKIVYVHNWDSFLNPNFVCGVIVSFLVIVG